MAYQDDKYHRQAQVDAWEHLLGYAVLDQAGDKIGTVKALWEDYTRQPAYLGVSTSWLDMGRIHVVPAQFATLSERHKCLRLPFPADVVKGAPECNATDEITLSGETKIRDYYAGKGIGARPVRPADWSARDRLDEDEDPRSLKDRIRDDVDEGKARYSRDHGPDAEERAAERRGETYGRAEREMGLPFEEEKDRPSLRKIYRETPVAEPVRPHDPENARREDDDFVPLRRDLPEGRRREGEHGDLPLR